MEVGLRPTVGVKMTRRSREIGRIRTLLRYLSEHPELHGTLRPIATFHLTNGIDGVPSEKGRAKVLVHDLRREFGSPEVAGFVFKVGRSEDDTEEYVMGLFDPRRIQRGAWERFEQEKRRRKQAAHERYLERKNRAGDRRRE